MLLHSVGPYRKPSRRRQNSNLLLWDRVLLLANRGSAMPTFVTEFKDFGPGLDFLRKPLLSLKVCTLFSMCSLFDDSIHAQYMIYYEW